MKNFIIRNDSFLKGFDFAKSIANQTGGRIATMPDFASMRTKNDYNKDLVWHAWMIPATTLYFGTYNDKRIIVVAHHFGPLTTHKRLLKWEKSGEKDPGSNNDKYGMAGCPKITQDEFNQLVEGKYGEVKIIDFNEYHTNFKKHLENGHIKIDGASQDPLLESLLSIDTESYKAFLNKCYEISKDFAAEQQKEEGSAEKILELSIEDSHGCSLYNPYNKSIPFPDKPIAFMFLFQRPSFYGNHDLSVSTELHSYESLGYAQFVVLNDINDKMIDLVFDPIKHWDKCLVPNDEKFDETFFMLTDTSKKFAVYPKRTDGSYMDTGAPMFPVVEIEKIGKPTSFTTNDCMFFLKYHIDEVRKIAPEGANSYVIIGDVQGRGTVNVPVQFYKTKLDTTNRILRSKEVIDDLDLLLKINNIKLEMAI